MKSVKIDGAKLAAARKAKRMSQADLAALVGSTADTIGRYERLGINGVLPKIFRKLPAALGVEETALLPGSEVDVTLIIPVTVAEGLNALAGKKRSVVEFLQDLAKAHPAGNMRIQTGADLERAPKKAASMSPAGRAKVDKKKRERGQ